MQLPKSRTCSSVERASATSGWWGQHRDAIQKRLQEALTPEQMETLGRIISGNAAYRLSSPMFREKLDLTKEQSDQIQRLADEDRRSLKQRNRQRGAEALAILSPQQRAQLHEEDLNRLFGQLLQGTYKVEGESGRTVKVVHDAPYADFSYEETQKELGLSEVQRQQVREILGDSATQLDKLAQRR